MKIYFYPCFGIALLALIAYSYRPEPANPDHSINTKNSIAMKMNTGIITTRLQESKVFYQQVFNFGVTFENEFYVLLHSPDKKTELSFLFPDHPSQQPVFQPAFTGKGIYMTIEVDDVDEEYNRIQSLGIEIAVPIRSEPWGDRHFSFYDPNGVGIDVVTYTAPGTQDLVEKSRILPGHL